MLSWQAFNPHLWGIEMSELVKGRYAYEDYTVKCDDDECNGFYRYLDCSDPKCIDCLWVCSECDGEMVVRNSTDEDTKPN